MAKEKKTEKEETLSQKFKRNPQSIGPWLKDILSGKAKVSDIPALLDDCLRMKVGDVTADLSEASTVVAKTFTDIAKNDPALHNALMLTIPAYPDLYNTARIKMFASRLNAGRGEVVTAEEIAKVAGGLFATSLFPGNPALQAIAQPTVAPGVADMGRHGAQQAAHLAADFENWAEYAVQILTTVRGIATDLSQFVGYLDKDIRPAVEMMRDLVVNPYLAAVKDSKASMDELIKHYQDAGQSVDSSVPSIIGPNLDLRQYQQIALGYSLPIVGSVYTGMTRGLIMQKYQAQHQRGFADDLSMLQSAMSFGGPSLLTPVQQIIQAGRPPAWFMSK